MRRMIETEPDVFASREYVLARPEEKQKAVVACREKLRALAFAVKVEVGDLVGLGEDGNAEFSRFVDLLKKPTTVAERISLPYVAKVDVREPD